MVGGSAKADVVGQMAAAIIAADNTDFITPPPFIILSTGAGLPNPEPATPQMRELIATVEWMTARLAKSLNPSSSSYL